MPHLLKIIIVVTTIVASVVVQAGTVSATDALQRTITLQKPAQRIVALAPYLTELAFAADSGDLVVGTVEFSDYPEAAQSIPRIGNNNVINYEALIAIQPDLVLVWQTGNGNDVMTKLTALHLPVFVSEPRQLEDISTELTQIGQLTGRDSHARQAARDFKNRLRQLREQYQHKERVSVFYQIWHSPMQTLNGNHIVSDVINLCGGINVFGNAPAIAPVVGIEAVLSADPQAILVSGTGMTAPTWLSEWRTWPTLQAVRNKHVYFIPADLLQRHTPRILDGAQQVCSKLEEVRKDQQSATNQ